MPNLYNKLMAKDMPSAAAAPTSRQMVAAPMGLRSAMKRYAEGGVPQGMTPPPPDDPRRREETRLPPEMETRRPPEEPRYEEPRPDPRFVMPEIYPVGVNPGTTSEPTFVKPEIYPQDYAGPRTSNTSQTQQVGPRTSYRINDDGSRTEIGYDGQPVSGYTPEQWAMHNATTGVTPSEFRYVWNGEGYDKVRTGGITMDDGTFIAGADNGQGGMDIGGPAFFAKYANDPITMARLREMYGFTGAEPEYRQPQIGYNPEENVPPPPRYDPGYERQEPMYERPEETRDPRMEMLRKALSGQGVGSLADSQRLAELLRSMGYSK